MALHSQKHLEMKLKILFVICLFHKNSAPKNAVCNHGEIIQDSSDVSCRSFYLCSHGHRMLMTCAPGTMFDPKCLCCNHMTMVSCSTAAASIMKGACEENFGVYANPVDPTCTTFIQCSWSEPYVRDCNPGLLFNSNSKLCDFSNNVDCTVKRPKENKTSKVIINQGAMAISKNLKSGIAPKVICFYPNWSFWRKAMGKFTPTDIDPNLCTHIVYAYAVIDRDNLIVKPGDEWLDVEKNNIKSFIALKKINPKVKTLITIGGWVDSQQNREAYNLVFNNDKLRSAYIQSMVKFLDKYGFDGVDISFEFPQINEREGYLVWIKALKEAFDSDVNRYELLVSIPANVKKIQEGYALKQLTEYIDGFHVMAFDLHGPWESVTDHHAPLFRRKWDTTYNYIDATIQNIIDHGVPPYKIILGMPTYGRSWSIRDPHQWLPMQPPVQAKGAAPAGFLTKAAGSMGYMEICLKVKNAGWIEVDDPEGPYAYSKDRSIWVGYDTPGSAADKAYYIIERGLGGAMIWDLPQDDFSNACGKGKFPILRAINKVFKGEVKLS